MRMVSRPGSYDCVSPITSLPCALYVSGRAKYLLFSWTRLV
nr:MAG TPA: hypothetical protein [Caudoviricetes sp.]